MKSTCFESVKWISIFSCFAFRLKSFRHAMYRKESHLNWIVRKNFTKNVPCNLTPSKAKKKGFDESLSIENSKFEIRQIDYSSCIGVIVALAYCKWPSVKEILAQVYHLLAIGKSYWEVAGSQMVCAMCNVQCVHPLKIQKSIRFSNKILESELNNNKKTH